MSDSRRYQELDSLRGIAAISVVFSHLFFVIPLFWDTTNPKDVDGYMQLLMFSPIRAFWAGHEAVIFFFVLSGFVLSIPFYRHSGETRFGSLPEKYFTNQFYLYLIKRFIRIYFPYLIAVLCAFVLRGVFYDGKIASVSGWFNQSWDANPTIPIFIQHLLLIPSFNNSEFDPVLWSLVHEMRISLFFPLIILAIDRFGKFSLLLPILFTVIHWLSISLNYRQVISFDHDYFATIHFTGFFILGAYLAKHREFLIAQTQKLSRKTKCILLFLALLAYTNTFWLQWYLPESLQFFRLLFSKIQVQEWITAAGIIIFIFMALASANISKILNTRLLLFLGAISYSLYLFHALALKVTVIKLHHFLSIPWLLIISFVLSIIVAMFFWKLVELPSLRLNRAISDYWKKSFNQ